MERSARSLLIEGLVIVASILLAFAIDTGWNELREREQEQVLLKELGRELDLYLDLLGPQAFRNTDRVEADTMWLLDAIHGAEVFEPSEWQSAVSSLGRAYQFTAATPVFDLLTADGGLQRISDPEIRDQLADVAAFLGIARRFEAIESEFLSSQLLPWLTRNIDRYAIVRASDDQWADKPPSRFESGMEALESREFSNLLIERRSHLYLVTLFRRQALERMESLREMVRSQIED